MKNLLRRLKNIKLATSLATILCSAVGSADFSGYTRYEYNLEGNSGDVVSRNHREPGYPDYKAAQTFEIGALGPNEHFRLKGVSLEIWKEGNPLSDLTVAIYDVDKDTGNPKHLVIETTIQASEISENREWHEIPLPEHLMNRNKSYAIVLNGEGDSDNVYWWGIKDGDSYSGGGAYLYDSGHGPSVWWRMGPPISIERDFKFEVYGEKTRQGPKD